ncbi:sensor histidine kinase [Paracoccus laeviglucosivorans]|uniref:C4-dicarboxylate transport sensor protein DctB n=1 Tax=Paracoccus laeviglucosivorans TaxID=1197861 RepID=A0A521CXT8_9RHOB|nr:ATP-binding protein [Paracoccus laeviglucosivorans]SMO64222.1 two-component system, NtrC family, C4-dicarboxylate transport sensor histidine kinase DctB [Paracoccus laeviglucosivorans]
MSWAPVVSTRISKRLIAAAIAAAALVVWLGGQVAWQHYFAAGHARASNALRLTVNALNADLARYEVVPQLVGDLDLIHELVADPGNPDLRRQTNLWLAEQNQAVQASDIYLILPDGETIAHSTWEGPASFIGENFSYRPYFIDAMAGRAARFYGVGTTSGVRGYYFSAPVRDDAGRITAVMAVKIGVGRIEASWQGGDFRTMVTDPEGAVFLSSDPGWLYHSIHALTPERMARTAATRRYANLPLTEFSMQSVRMHGVPVFQMPAADGWHDYITASEEMADAGWTVHVMLDSAELRAEARLAMLTLLLLISAAGFGGLIWWQRRVQAAERLAMQQFANAELERRVTERTADLARVNSQLEQEIAERRATEAELRAAQESLVQVGKLAALGQMSASLSHEINQPLAAARNYADSAAILIERGDYARARENIGEILALVDRMAAIGKHLRHAARKPDDQLGAVPLTSLLHETQTIVAARLASSGAVLTLDVPDGLPPLRAGPTRLQQVLVNLLTNAADAVEGRDDRRITLSARVQGDRIAIRVRDHGPGIPDAIAARIFDPFFTTKGFGLGLGLSITSNIVRDFGGEISCRNAAPGAEFCVTLPIAAAEAAA